MEARELRIGNLVLTNSEEPEIMKIDAIDGVEQNVMLDTIDKWQPLDGYLPISLTEYWLKRAGFRNLANMGIQFKYDGDGFRVTALPNFLNPMEESYIFDYKSHKPPFCAVGSIKFVHDLQNWFKINTGTELEFTD